MTNRTCSIDGCERKHKGRGWCESHFRKFLRYGSPLGVSTLRGQPGESLAVRMERIGWTVKQNECWEWNGAKGEAGHGQIRIDKKSRQAHRIMFEIHYGPVPEGDNVLHRCDNPPCVNPGHLFSGTQKQNMDDMWAKGRQQEYVDQPLGSKHPNAKLLENDVLELRRLRESGSTYKSLAERFGISKSTVADIVSRKNWRHI